MSETSKRPLAITIVCIVAFIGFAVILFSLMVPTNRDLLVQRYGPVIIFFTFLTLVFGVAGMIGYWRMSRWGVYLYCVMVIISLAGGMLLNLPARPMAYATPLVIIAVGAAYFKHMK